MHIKKTSAEMIAHVAEVAKAYHEKCPVLIITKGAEKDELQLIVKALVDAFEPPEADGLRREPSRFWEELRRMVMMHLRQLIRKNRAFWLVG